MASDAVSRALSREAISVAIGQEPVIVQPPRIMPESSASQPSVVLWAKTIEPMPSSCRTRRPSGEGFRHRLLEPRAVLRTTIFMLGLVLHRLASLG